ncbi:hypothetical protein O181_120454, partial [Austropuccinia psidii MF-1]|nr:hypothetical protein [Austropuccinia psidii MF-1]
YRRTADPDRECSDSFRITRSRPNQLSSGLIPFRNQQISGQDSPFFTIPGGFQKNARIQGKKQDNIQPEEERVRPNDPEAVGFGERSAQEQEVVFAELEASHEKIKILTASMDKIAKNLQLGHAQLRKASEETNKRLNLVFEEQHHSKRDRDCLDKGIKKLFNVYHSTKPQPQGHVMDNPYHQDYIKPDAMFMNRARSPSQYQYGDNMSYSEKEAFKLRI